MDRSGMKKCELFSPCTIRDVTLKNRVAVSPMCQYSSVDGHPTEWHHIHLGSRAVGGAALVMVEATAVEARGRISPDDMGIWDDSHIESLRRCADVIRQNGAVPAIQIAHAGRKASTSSPWKGRKVLTPEDGGWQVVGPSPVPFSEHYPVPHELAVDEIHQIASAFADAAVRAVKAGFEIVEIHSAHGYLLHSFLSPLSNHRSDEFGGSLDNRMRFTVIVSEMVRKVIPEGMPLFVRISATDWVEGGWDQTQSIALAARLRHVGVDLIDCSSGMLVPEGRPEESPGFQVPFAELIRMVTKVMTGAVGVITEPEQAEEIIASGKADLVFLAREMLWDPYWPLHAALKLGAMVQWPAQYQRALEHKEMVTD